MTQRTTRAGEEWLTTPVELPERLEELTRRSDPVDPRRLETDEASASLTDLQRSALRWLASFD